MDKTLAAVYAVTRNDLKTLPSYRSAPNRQGAMAYSKSQRVKMLNPVLTLRETITTIKEALLKK